MATWFWNGNIKIGTSDQTIDTGTGLPEGVVTAPKGSLYMRIDGPAGGCLFVKETSTGNTGWVVIASGSGLTPPAGPNTAIQYNNSGSFAGDSGLKWDVTSKIFTVNGAVSTFISADTADVSYPYYVNNQSVNFTNLTGVHTYIGGRNLSVNYQGTTGLPSPIQLFGDLILVNNGTSSDPINNLTAQLLGVQTSGSSDVSGYVGSSIVVSHGSTGIVNSILGLKVQITGPMQTSPVSEVNSIYVVSATTAGWTGLANVNGILIEDQGISNNGTTVTGLRVNAQTNDAYAILTLGGVSSFTSIATSTVAKVANYTVTPDDYTVNCNGTFTVTLPTTHLKIGQIFQIKNVGVGTITVSCSVHIDGSNTFSLPAQYQSVTVQWDGSQYWIY